MTSVMTSFNSQHSRPNSSETVGDSGFFSYWEPIGKWPGQSNGDITDYVTWLSDVKRLFFLMF